MRSEPGSPELGADPVPPNVDADGGAAPAIDGTPVPGAIQNDVLPDASQNVVVQRPIPSIPSVVDVSDLPWAVVRDRVDAGAVRARLRAVVEGMEALLDREDGPGLLFDADRAVANDRAIRVGDADAAAPLWIVGDLHGDLLALEAALELVRRERPADGPPARIVFLGDFFDDGGYGLEILIRVFELVLATPSVMCIVAGNHDEALHYDGARFSASVRPSDFADYLNENLAHEWITRVGKLAVRLFATVPRALFLPDGLLVTHGGFPLTDLHAELRQSGDWNDPRCLSDFTWTRAHPRARRKLPNRTSRGSQFGYEDFAAFCTLAEELGRPVTCMVRGHDHVDERYEIPPAYASHPVLTTVALSRRLGREIFGPYERAPTVARWIPGALPQVHRLCIPPALVCEVYPDDDAAAGEPATADAVAEGPA